MIVDDFNRITGLDYLSYSNRFRLFVENMLPLIIGYHSGTYKSISSEVYKEIDEIHKLSLTFDSAVVSNSNRFHNSEYWDVVTALDEMSVKIMTIKRMPRWLRAPVDFYSTNTSPEIEVSVGSMSTIEDLAASVGYSNPDNDWADIAIRNDLDEDDYTTDGGMVLMVNGSGNSSVVINDVVDIMSGDNAYGKDVFSVITFDNDDIKTVEGLDCAMQCYTNLINLRKGGIPEHPEMGIGEIMTGNIAAFSYPVILRQVHNTLYRDDSVSSVGISSFDTNGDSVSLSIIIKSKLGMSLPLTVQQ